MADKSRTATAEGSQRPTTDDPNASTSKRRKLSPEELENLSRRIYTDAISTRQKKLQQLEEKFYRTEPPKTLDAATIEASAQRQVTQEMERRKKREEELREKFFKTEEGKKLSEAELEECTRRIYSDAIRQRQDRLEKLDQKYALRPKTSDPLTTDKRKAMADRLCKPKKPPTTDEEINRILGLPKFEGVVSLPPVKVKELADRLSKPKS